MTGTVVSDKMEKTAVVRVETLKPHPLYHKVVRRHKRYKAHDEANEAHTGDVVIIEECKPLSKDKTWRIVEWLERRGVT
jgi:small subunit ribosomal protein S17